jgi:hypothetical protein
MATDVPSATGILFAAGFAVQRVVEILDGALDALADHLGSKNVWKLKKEAWKKLIAGLLATGCGFAIAGLGGLRVVKFLTSDPVDRTVDLVVSALAIGAGTEGVNSVLKYASGVKRSVTAQADLAEQVKDGNVSAATLEAARSLVQIRARP